MRILILFPLLLLAAAQPDPLQVLGLQTVNLYQQVLRELQQTEARIITSVTHVRSHIRYLDSHLLELYHQLSDNITALSQTSSCP